MSAQNPHECLIMKNRPGLEAGAMVDKFSTMGSLEACFNPP